MGEAVAFLEAFVNELFQDAADATKADPVPGTAVRLRGLSDDLVRLMAAYWNSTDEGERVRTLDKYDAARLFAGCPRQDRGRLPDLQSSPPMPGPHTIDLAVDVSARPTDERKIAKGRTRSYSPPRTWCRPGSLRWMAEVNAD